MAPGTAGGGGGGVDPLDVKPAIANQADYQRWMNAAAANMGTVAALLNGSTKTCSLQRNNFGAPPPVCSNNQGGLWLVVALASWWTKALRANS